MDKSLFSSPIFLWLSFYQNKVCASLLVFRLFLTRKENGQQTVREEKDQGFGSNRAEKRRHLLWMKIQKKLRKKIHLKDCFLFFPWLETMSGICSALLRRDTLCVQNQKRVLKRFSSSSFLPSNSLTTTENFVCDCQSILSLSSLLVSHTEKKDQCILHSLISHCFLSVKCIEQSGLKRQEKSKRHTRWSLCSFQELPLEMPISSSSSSQRN